LKPKEPDLPADVDTSHTAIYDITSRTVYLPDGRRLEAHSGLGSRMDDPHYVSAKDTGPTPPNVYELKMRESLFHGVRAIRLVPTDDSKMFGRDGILAHTYLLGPSGQSNGCVSFSVIQRLRDVPGRVSAGRHKSSRRGRTSRERTPGEDSGRLACQHAQGHFPGIVNGPGLSLKRAAPGFVLAQNTLP
jgi:hypothetical protein